MRPTGERREVKVCQDGGKRLILLGRLVGLEPTTS
jgi:hypothetical protein